MIRNTVGIFRGLDNANDQASTEFDVEFGDASPVDEPEPTSVCQFGLSCLLV